MINRISFESPKSYLFRHYLRDSNLVLLRYVMLSWKVPIYYINGALMIINCLPLYKAAAWRGAQPLMRYCHRAAALRHQHPKSLLCGTKFHLQRAQEALSVEHLVASDIFYGSFPEVAPGQCCRAPRSFSKIQVQYLILKEDGWRRTRRYTFSGLLDGTVAPLGIQINGFPNAKPKFELALNWEENRI